MQELTLWCSSVRTLLRLPLRDRHFGVTDLRALVGAGQVDVLEPFIVVPLRKVRAELRSAALGAVDRTDAGALRAVEHVAELDRAEDVLVEDCPLVVDVAGLVLLLQALDRL